MATPKKADGTRIRKENRWGDSKRFYQVGDNQYPSVTTILQVIGKPALINWAAKMERELVLKSSADLYEDCPLNPRMSRTGWITTLQSRLTKEKAHQKELKKAGDIGSQVHKLIEWGLKAEMCYDAGPAPAVCDAASWAYMSFQDWRKSVKLKPLFIEQVVWSNLYGYAGTLDLIAEIEGKVTVIDWKSGSGIYAEAYLQNAAYRHAIREMGHHDPVAGLIVRLPKIQTDPEFEVKEAPPEKECMEVFLNAMRLWTWTQKMEAAKDNAQPEPDLEKQLQDSIAQRQNVSAA